MTEEIESPNHVCAVKGKRADVKNPSININKRYFGKFGFIRKRSVKTTDTINLSDITQKLDKLVNQKLIEMKNDAYMIDLKKLGYHKLLGSSAEVKQKLIITVESASQKAIDKVKIVPKCNHRFNNYALGLVHLLFCRQKKSSFIKSCLLTRTSTALNIFIYILK